MPLQISYNASLKSFNTFGVDAHAWALINVPRWAELPAAIEVATEANRPLLVLGQGSNVLFRSDFPGVVLQIKNRGKQVVHDRDGFVLARIAAGESWHNTVLWAAEQGLWGIENLALIPGQVGAAPIQNIGAYGAELSEVLTEVQCYDRQQHTFCTLSAEQCGFGYRSSRFRDADAERFVITECVLRLARQAQPKTNYPGIRDELTRLNLTDAPTPLDLATAVSNIRQRKLPDPAITGNAGSFFKNPQVSRTRLKVLQERHPDIPVYPGSNDQSKLSAAWMIEHCGWRGKNSGNAGVSSQHALVLINRGNATGQDIWRLANEVAESVRDQFGIVLEPEPQII